MRLFEIIPDRFFSVLTSPLKEDYAAILFKIYEQYLLTTFGIEREVLVDVIVDYIEEEEKDSFGRELDNEIWEESMDNPAGARDRAADLDVRRDRYPDRELYPSVLPDHGQSAGGD